MQARESNLSNPRRQSGSSPSPAATATLSSGSEPRPRVAPIRCADDDRSPAAVEYASWLVLLRVAAP
jgi:hypothetical protein